MATTIRIAGVAGVLALAAAIIAAIITSSAGVAEEDLWGGVVTRYLPKMTENWPAYIGGIGIVIVSMGLLVPYAAGLYQVLQNPKTVLRLGLLALVGAVLCSFVGLASTWVVAETLAPAYVGALEGTRITKEAIAVGTTAEAFNRFYFHMFWLAYPLWGVTALVYGLAQFRSGVLPRWPAFIAMVAGVLGLLGGLGTLSFALHTAGFIGLLLVYVWAGITGATMLRVRPHAAQ